VDDGQITPEEGDAFVSSAAQSQIYNRNFVPPECAGPYAGHLGYGAPRPFVVGALSSKPPALHDPQYLTISRAKRVIASGTGGSLMRIDICRCNQQIQSWSCLTRA
jgi:hypothetical protein